MTTPANRSDGGAPQGFRVVEVAREPVELYKVLKFEGMAGSGGEAKAAVAAGKVRVNGEVERQKRKQILAGDTIEFNDDRIRISLSSPISKHTTHPAPDVNTGVAAPGSARE